MTFEENVGGVWTDEVRGLAMLGAVGFGVLLFAWFGMRRRPQAQ
jgi:hypothetical protein